VSSTGTPLDVRGPVSRTPLAEVAAYVGAPAAAAAAGVIIARSSLGTAGRVLAAGLFVAALLAVGFAVGKSEERVGRLRSVMWFGAVLAWLALVQVLVFDVARPRFANGGRRCIDPRRGRRRRRLVALSAIAPADRRLPAPHRVLDRRRGARLHHGDRTVRRRWPDPRRGRREAGGRRPDRHLLGRRRRTSPGPEELAVVALLVGLGVLAVAVWLARPRPGLPFGGGPSFSGRPPASGTLHQPPTPLTVPYV
jgi:hypothetical protein